MHHKSGQKISSSNRALLESRNKGLKEGRPFSMVSCGLIDGVEVINDSAATNIETLAHSLSAIDKPLVWILEANENCPDFRLLSSLVREKAKAIVAMGPFSDKVHSALWASKGWFVAAHSWEEALDLGTMVARQDDIILFSPGCRSNEPFSNYKERGEYFNWLINNKRNSKT